MSDTFYIHEQPLKSASQVGATEWRRKRISQAGYQEWVAWDGHNESLYQPPTIVIHNGFLWECMVENNHWEPGAPGIGENIWKNLGEYIT